jgi:predicted amidohydrolase
MKAGFVQFSPLFGKKAENIKEIEGFVSSADADLLVLPELALSGYTFTSKKELRELAEPFETSESLKILHKLSKDMSCSLVVGFPELAGKNVYNSAALLRPDGTKELYRKIHLFGTETLFFTPGDKPFKVYDLNGVKIGIIICFDWYFPESIRTLALMGAQIICQPANLVLTWCQKAMVIRGIENRVFTITCNRYGAETRGNYSFTFTGESQMTSPKGDLLLKAPIKEDYIGITEINPADALNKKVTDYNDLFHDRRPKFYSEITKLSHME